MIFVSIMSSCSEVDFPKSRPEIKSYFNQAFPKRAKNLKFILGNEFSLIENGDTTVFKVDFNRKNRNNVIIYKNINDTLFEGVVSKHKGLFYFSEKVSDSLYWIYAVEIKGNFIRGLNSSSEQMKQWDEEFKSSTLDSSSSKSQYQSMIQFKKEDKILLTPDKTLMPKFYSSIISKLNADTLYFKSLSADQKIYEGEEIEITTETNSNIIEKVFPNPIVGNIFNVTLSKKDEFQFQILDLHGKVLHTGILKDFMNEVSVPNLKAGSYLFQVFKQDEKFSQTVKLLKK